MGYNTNNTVRIPKADLQLDGESIYLVLERDTSKRKHGPITKRVLIGTIVDAQHMLPNDNYWEYFLGVTHKATGEAAKQKWLSSSKSVIRKDGDLLDLDSVYDKSLSVGGVAIVRSLIESLGLDTILTNIFGKIKGLMIVDLAAYLCLDGKLNFNAYTGWAANHLVYQRKAAFDGTVTRFLRSGIESDQIQEFFSQWNKNRDFHQRIYLHISKPVMQNFGVILEDENGMIDQLDGNGFRLITALTQNESLPLFYFPVESDQDLVNQILNQVHQMGYSNIGFFIDDPQLFQEHLDAFMKSGCPWILTGWNSSCFDEVIEQYGQALKEDEKAWIPIVDYQGTTVSYPLTEQSEIPCYWHLYYNEDQVKQQQKRLDDHYAHEQWVLKQMILDGLRLKDINDPDHVYDYVVKRGWIKSFRVNEERRRLLVNRCGFTSIITSEQMSAKQAVMLLTEQANGLILLKNQLAQMEQRLGVENSYEKRKTEIFLGVLASILVSQITEHLKHPGQEIVDPKTYKNTLNILNRIQGVRTIQPDDYSVRFIRPKALTKKQNEILQAFGLGEEDIDLLLATESLNLKSDQ